jgi:hypothetical protein
MTEASVKAPNSLLLIGDPQGQPPTEMGGQLVAATSSCLAVGTLSEFDGETHVRLIDAGEAGVRLSPSKVFDGELQLNSGRLIVGSVLGTTYLDWPTRGTAMVHVQVWVNHLREPNDICVVVRDGESI